MNLTDTYKVLVDDAVSQGYKQPLDIYLYIDKTSTFNINLVTAKQVLLTAHYLHDDNNYMYRMYFHLMMVLQIKYNYLLDTTKWDAVELSKYNKLVVKLNILNIQCGIYGFKNTHLYSDVLKYTEILRPELLNIIKAQTLYVNQLSTTE